MNNNNESDIDYDIKQSNQYTRDEIGVLRRELEKIDKIDEEYIREPAPTLNLLNPQS